MYAGIDIGYNATKAVSGERRASFASAVGSPDRARFRLEGGPSGIILTEPQHVLVGDEAIEQSRFLQRREDRRWFEGEEWVTLFLAAVTELTAATVAELDLVTGLPVSFYEDRESVAARLTGEHRVCREGRRAQIVRVRNVRVIPQPFGTLLAEVLSESGQVTEQKLARATVGIIDVGGKTCNLLSVTRLAEISRATASVNVGGWDLVRGVRAWLSDHCAGLDDLRDHQLAAAIQAREIRFYGEPVAAFAGVVDAMAGELAGQVISQASQLWNGGAMLDAILVTGGGALLLGDAIRRQWRHARVVSDPVFGNAVGYARLARRLFRE